MNRTTCRLLLVVFLISLIGCTDNSVDRSEPSGQSETEPLVVTIQAGDRYQAIHGFGASDAWSTQFVGKNWPLEKRQQIADLLFSSEPDPDGNPEGIGLSIWRFNIGAGSARQGEESGIGDPYRRSESFLTEDGTFDWSRQEGQQWFMQAASERGVETFVGFVNSPPILLTRNGNAYGDGGSRANIAPSNYDDFADYLVRIARYFEEQGTPFTYLSPVNEPQWDWAQGNGQEGSPYHNDELAGVAEALDQKIQEEGLDVQIEIPETAQIDYLYSDEDQDRGNQIEYFFGEESSVKDLPSLAQKMAAHSYFTTYPVEQMVEQRSRIREKMIATDPDVEYWMSEFCVLGDVGEGLEGGGRDLGIDPALYVARVMHYDLTVAHASSWQWWIAVSPYNYKDGLVYVDRDVNDGDVYESKILWGVGNFSRFIRPGAVRVGADRSDNLTPVQAGSDVMVSAYLHEADGDLTVVAVNYSSDEREIELDLDGVDLRSGESLTPYITSEDSDLEPGETVDPGQTFTLPSRSIVTFTGRVE
ncbi:MAG: glycoside hydrolase [Balneolaceae bacterium]